jgi:heme oxygenase (biliverdin-IX-beta and delta-forming)
MDRLLSLHTPQPGETIMLLTTLREETSAYHERIERSPLFRGLLSPTIAPRFYAAALGINYGFYAPLEARLLFAADWSALGFDLNVRLKTPLIEADLACFGLEGELLRALPACAHLPRLPDLPAALGCLYVLEGATLCGQLIARQLTQNLKFAPDHGTAFFSSYRTQVRPMWQQFAELIEYYGSDQSDAVIAAASATYAALEIWYAEGYRAITGTRVRSSQYAVR